MRTVLILNCIDCGLGECTFNLAFVRRTLVSIIQIVVQGVLVYPQLLQGQPRLIFPFRHSLVVLR